MYANISRWGNSQGLRIPKHILETLNLRENDRVEVTCDHDSITIRKARAPHRTLEDRLTSFYGKPLDQITPISQKEQNWGKTEGGEAW